ncbi:MAG: VPLPA-CTERM-specific exosortase XrtD [Methylococcales bacterium]|nr:VPLPA-CTERM-specific exosortase XrtD [Methylococcales bacterium]
MNTFINKNYFFILLSFILVLSLYWNVFSDLIDIWDSKEEYSHGYMLPFVALYFIWLQKDLILSIKFNPSYFGFAMSFFALTIYFIGIVGDVYSLLRFSFIFLLIAIALSIGGFKVTRLLLVPLLLLVFSFPLPPVVQAGLTSKLQLISSQLGVSFIRACEIPVFLEGNVIDLGNYKLQVVEACSGLRYLFPLMSLAFICAYMYQVTFWKRAILFLTSIPVTVLMNSFRIGIIGLLVDNWGITMAEGFIHDFEGWIVFMACFIILFFVMWLLSWTERKERGWESVFGLIVPAPEAQEATLISTTPNYSPLISVLLLLTITIIAIKPLGEIEDIIPDRKSFNEFPSQLSGWSGVSVNMDQNTIDFLGLSDYVLMNFNNPSKTSQVNFYIAYYQTQKHGAVPHSPKLCIPGGGWLITDISESSFKGIEFNRVIISKDKIQQLVYYWYRQRGKDIANEYALKWNTFIGAFQYKRTDGALIRLTTTLSANETVENADERLQKFISSINEKIPEYVPD